MTKEKKTIIILVGLLTLGGLFLLARGLSRKGPPPKIVW